MRFEDTIEISRSPEDVFAYMTDPARLPEWQTIKTAVEPLGDGPPGLGQRVREQTRTGPRRWWQTVEFTRFEPGRAFGVTVVEGPRSTGVWTFERTGEGTRLHFTGEADVPRLLEPLLRRAATRQFRRHHANLKRRLEAG